MEPVTISAIIIGGLYTGLVTFLGGEAARERDNDKEDSNDHRDDDRD